MLLPRAATAGSGNYSARLPRRPPEQVPPESADRFDWPNAVLRPQGSCESPREKLSAPETRFPKIRLLFGPSPPASLETHGIAAMTSRPECPGRRARTAAQIHPESNTDDSSPKICRVAGPATPGALIPARGCV